LHKEEGISPPKAFLSILRVRKLMVKSPRELGIVPVMQLFSICSSLIAVSKPSDDGTGPESKFLLAPKYFIFISWPRELGRLLEKLFEAKFRVFMLVQSPILEGNWPRSELPYKRTTSMANN
jgi:hypothetical protein